MKLYKSEFIERLLVPSCQECPHRRALIYKNRDKYFRGLACSAITRTRLDANGLTVSYHPPISLFLPDCPLEDAGPGDNG
jgi:hypothetical protein